MVSTVKAPVPPGSSQLLSREEFDPLPVHDLENFPYQSEVWLLQDLGRYGNPDRHIEIVERQEGPLTRDETQAHDEVLLEVRTLRVRIYTAVNCYSIIAKEKAEGPGYLGCTAISRMPRAGEDWHRSNDLADGPLNVRTWYKILADIVSYEMVKVHDPAKARADAQIDEVASAKAGSRVLSA